MYTVSPEYFDVMRLPIRRGRTFDARDEGAVVLEEQAAERLFGDRDPVGLEVRMGSSRSARRRSACVSPLEPLV